MRGKEKIILKCMSVGHKLNPLWQSSTGTRKDRNCISGILVVVFVSRSRWAQRDCSTGAGY